MSCVFLNIYNTELYKNENFISNFKIKTMKNHKHKNKKNCNYGKVGKGIHRRPLREINFRTA